MATKKYRIQIADVKLGPDKCWLNLGVKDGYPIYHFTLREQATEVTVVEMFGLQPFLNIKFKDNWRLHEV